MIYVKSNEIINIIIIVSTHLYNDTFIRHIRIDVGCTIEIS